MNTERVETVADAIAGLGYDGIAAFDQHEPEYGTLETLYDEYETPEYVQILAICATTQDFQLNGDAQRFWQTLTDVSLAHGSLASRDDVEEILWTFMEQPVNARFTNMKSDRLQQLSDSGFVEWFLANHDTAAPLTVWEQLAEGLENEMHKKTVVLSMKVYDIAHLIHEGEYLKFPRDIPIPVDLQVERVTHAAGITNTDDPEAIRDIWADIMEAVSERVGRHISLLRIDSIVWQAGQIIGDHEPDAQAARSALHSYFVEDIGLSERDAAPLADELTAEM